MTGEAFRAIALALPGVAEKPHFDRTAFRVKRQFATLSGDGADANLLLEPDDQAHYCELLPNVFTPIPNKFGAWGWTRVALGQIDADTLAGPIRAAWLRGGGKS